MRTQGDWEAWVGFFLDALTGAATEAEGSIIALATLVTSDRRRLLVEPLARSVAYRLLEMLPTTPRFTIESNRQKLATQATGVQLPALHRYPVAITLPICNEPSVDATRPTA